MKKEINRSVHAQYNLDQLRVKKLLNYYLWENLNYYIFKNMRWFGHSILGVCKQLESVTGIPPTTIANMRDVKYKTDPERAELVLASVTMRVEYQNIMVRIVGREPRPFEELKIAVAKKRKIRTKRDA
jgi:hypothetical protein